MATLDSLPGDQRAVLQLVLGRGRSYDEIARLLSINPEAVSARALAALDALGPQTRVAAADRRRICDYLLGQLPESEVPAVRERLAHAAPERAWARVLASELAPVASGPLPEVPVEGAPAPAQPAARTAAEASAAEAPTAETSAAEAPTAEPGPPGRPSLSAAATGGGSGDAPPADDARPRSSRRGGIVVIGVAGLVVVGVVLVLVLHHDGGTRTSTTTPAATVPTSPAPTTTHPATTASGTAATSTAASGTGTSGASAAPLAQINLTPTQNGSKAEGVAEVLQEGNQRELAIVAQGLPPNTAHNAYEVWLYNSESDAVSVGFSPVVGANGKLSAAGPLPAHASHYKQLIVTTETTKSPSRPGPILMQGQVSGLS